ncbi:hypothetical protein BFJ69_g10339 [Fusarium oxysporum]|uniref:GPI inositol-deacylase winged helix domain-containing protein n=1 Tax=Fusarium oxysporum TaxID=5507 RepID=A0A420MW31_FUSOX|nr:hypothetical protein BFJ69_g10339 [Fusarium oxysporum]
MQLVNADETIMRLAYEKLSTMESAELADLKKLASDCFTSRLMVTLVLDGLDEAMDNEHEVSINWCLNELLPVAKSCSCKIKVLICGQRDGRLDALLSSYPQIRLDMVDDHQYDIEQFTKTQAAKIRARFSLTQDEEESLIFKVSGASQGMFLYARVVLDNLAAMDSIQEFEDELEGDTFPEDLDQAYDLIAQRILKKHGPSRHKTVKKILGWVVCATRPLRWREIQSRFCIDANKETCNIRNLRRDSCKSICSSLVDVTNCDLFPNVESEQVVSMVHETATKYLVRNDTVNLLQEHIDMALFCCRYLSSRSFTTGKSQSISADIHSGYFGFLDYAAAHYTVHIQEAEASEISTDSAPKLESVKAAAVDLVKANCKDAKEAAIDAEESDKVAQGLNLAIQDNVLVVRTLIGLQREKSETAIFDATEGPLRYKCHKIQCSKFATGCSSEATLKRHLAVHERPFRCPHTDCFAHTVGYASPKRLKSHNEAFHQSVSRAKAVFPADLETGEWSLYEACKAGNLDEVKRFHREGANLYFTLPKTVSPLCAAVEAGHGHVCKYLVDSGVNPLRRASREMASRTPIVAAIYRERLEILDFFLRSGNGPDDRGLAEVIARAIHADRPAALKMVLAARQPRDHEDMIKLVPVEILSQTDLRSFRIDSHSMDATLIHAWFQYVKPEFYNEKGAFIAPSDRSEYKIWGDTFFREHRFLHRAVSRRCHSFATFLMDIGSEDYLQVQDHNGETALHDCIRKVCQGDCSSCMYLVQRLLQCGGGRLANIPSNNGELPAHTAMMRNISQAALRAILNNTGDINHRDNSGESPLHKAMSADGLRVLLENKSVDLFSTNNKGQTVFSASIGDSFKIINATLAFNINAVEHLFEAEPRLAWTPDASREGFTPLHHAMKLLESLKLGSYERERIHRVAKFLLTCSEAKRVLVAYEARSTDADRKKVREFARKEMLQEALDIMDLILFGLV